MWPMLRVNCLRCELWDELLGPEELHRGYPIRNRVLKRGNK